MEIEHLILAKDSLIDRDKNTLSIFELVEDARIEAPPGQEFVIPVQLIAVIKRESKEVGTVQSKFKFTASLPSGNMEIPSNETPVELVEGVSRHRIRLNFPIQVKQGGVYRFRLEDTGKAGSYREVSIKLDRVEFNP